MGKIRAVVFDFGGVLAEEGFREGLKAIARKNGLDPEEFYRFVTEYIFQCGYLTGQSNEGAFWEGLRKIKGIRGTDEQLRGEVLRRFVLRPEMLQLVKALRQRGLKVAILSDQTNWLDEINEREGFFHLFDHVFNSYHIHRSKREVSLFKTIAGHLGLSPEEVLFIDDNPDNVQRARGAGLKGVVFEGVNELKDTLRQMGLWDGN